MNIYLERIVIAWKAALGVTKAALEWILLIVIIFSLVSELLERVFEFHLKEFIGGKLTEFISTYAPSLTPLASFAGRVWQPSLIIILLLLTLLLVRFRRRIHTLVVLLRQRGNEIRTYSDYRDRYKKCEATFHSLASQNAQRDRELFNTLFVEFPHSHLTKADKIARITIVKAAAGTVKTSLVNVLDAAKSLFEAMTGEECAACLQVLNQTPGLPIEDTDVYISARDSSSAAKRGTNSKIGTKSESHKVGLNTFSKRIFIENEDYIIENNLAERIKLGQIQSTSRNVGKTYDALFLFAIPNLYNEGVPITILCIDNKTGVSKDKEDVCIHFGKELAWRIAVMQYRLEYLVQEYKKLEKVMDVEETSHA